MSQFREGALSVNMLTDSEIVGLLNRQIQHCGHMYSFVCSFLSHSAGSVLFLLFFEYCLL